MKVIAELAIMLALLLGGAKYGLKWAEHEARCAFVKLIKENRNRYQLGDFTRRLAKIRPGDKYDY